MENIRSIFEAIIGAMILASAVLMLCPGRFEKKLISMLAVSYIVISLTKGGDFSLDLRREYDGIIAEAEDYADGIRADAEKYVESEERKNTE